MIRAVFYADPAEAAKKPLSEIIRQLARAHDTALIEPYVTFNTDFYPDEKSVLRVFERTVRDAQRLELALKGLECTELFTRSLLLEFHDDPRLHALYTSAESLSDRVLAYVYRPHMSLMYTELPMRDRLAIIDQLRLPERPFSFDRCGLAVTVDKPQSKADIEQWRLLREVPLVE